MKEKETMDMIARKQLKDYLKENLTIFIDETTDFGPTKKVTIKIELEDEVISESYYYPKD